MTREESAALNQLFDQAGVQGTFVLYDVRQKKYTIHNRERSKERFVPASTFKIPHTLIGLSVGAVETVDEIVPFGGEPQPFKSWEKDMSLRNAIKISNVAIYQELAVRIGLKRMQEKVIQMGYGNMEVGASISDFWLKGPLKISAVEQADFLSKLATTALPFDENLQEDTRNIVLIEKNAQWDLYGKTGWENAPNHGVGWWVGWVRKGHNIYSFALNIDIKNRVDARKRIRLGRACLEALGVF